MVSSSQSSESLPSSCWVFRQNDCTGHNSHKSRAWWVIPRFQMWEFWCEDFNIAAELWAKRRIHLSWKMSQELISLKFPPFFSWNTNTSREHVSREKLILSVFAHVLWVHCAAIYKRIEQGGKTRECFWDSLQMLMTDDSFVFIHAHDLAQACRNCED